MYLLKYSQTIAAEPRTVIADLLFCAAEVMLVKMMWIKTRIK